MDKKNNRIWFVFGLVGGLAVCLVTVIVLYFAVIRPQSYSTASLVATSGQQTAIAIATQSNSTVPPPTSIQSDKESTAILTEEVFELTPSPLSEIILISANANTNCREGPDTDYPILGHLQRGETSEVDGTNTYQTWWYIKNPENPENHCWVWGETTYVEGVTSDIRVVTPPPPPPPGPDFNASFEGYSTCVGFDYAVFRLENTGEVNLESMTLLLINTSKEQQLHFTSMMNRPFSSDSKACMRNWGYMEPGDIAYVAGDVTTSGNFGDSAQAQIKLCDEDSLRGRCVDRVVDFIIPYK